jgi:tRNA U38,U39,U40 pseudouridine synthase TruA
MSAPRAAPEPELHGVLLTLAYDGEPFCGYVKQKNGRTVAGELEGAIATVDPKASTRREPHRRGRARAWTARRVRFDA